jgi:citrate lyase subunit beta/citryl-CoA lyase
LAEGEPVTDWDSQLLRALLFVPGSDSRKLAKVATFGADAIVIDLEDAVADDEKTAARATTAAAIPTYDDGVVVIVRVNGRRTGRLVDDIASVVRPRLDMILIPKIEDTDTLLEADSLLARCEEEAGIPVGQIRLLALMETARGIVDCERILAAAPPRLLTAIFGLGDFSVDIGVDLTDDAAELAYGRSRLVVAARAAGLAKPIDGPYLNLLDEAGLVTDTLRSRQLGFQGRVAVYPPQVDPVQRTFSLLADEEVRQMETVVEAFEEAERRGVASIRVEGKFVDYPIYNRARAKLDRHTAYQRAVGSR